MRIFIYLGFVKIYIDGVHVKRLTVGVFCVDFKIWGNFFVIFS